MILLFGISDKSEINDMHRFCDKTVFTHSHIIQCSGEVLVTVINY